MRLEPDLTRNTKTNSNWISDLNVKKWGGSLVVQWLRPHTFNAGGTGSIPDQGTKIPHTSWHSQKIKHKKKELNHKTP